MRLFIISFSIALVFILSCEEGSSSGTAIPDEVVNDLKPSGPVKKSKKATTSTEAKVEDNSVTVDSGATDQNGTSSTDPNSSSASEPGNTPDSDSTTDAACLTGSCSTPQNLQIAFSQPVPISPYECSSVQKLKVIDFTNHLWIFSRASCASTRTYLYMEQRSYSGESLAAPELLSINCSTSTNYVSDFDVAKNPSGILLVYSCYLSYNSYRIDSLTIDSQGIPSEAHLIESTTKNMNITLTWNSEAGVYGMARESQFLRLATDGTVLGSPIVIPANFVSQMRSIDSDWVVLQASGSGSYSTTYCSKISSLGTLLCNGKKLGDGQIQLASEEQLLRFDTPSYVSAKVSALSFTLDTCSAFNESNTVSPNNSPSNAYDNKLYDSSSIYNNALVNVFQGVYGLMLGIYKRDTTLNLLSEIGIDTAEPGDVSEAHIAIYGEHLNVYYVKESKGYIVVSQQKVEE